MGQNPGYINNIETGKSLPSLTGIFYICEYLGVTPSEFFDMEVSNPSKLDAIVNDMKKLDDRQLDTIAMLVKDLIKNNCKILYGLHCLGAFDKIGQWKKNRKSRKH